MTTDFGYDFRLIVGTYERLLYGLDVKTTGEGSIEPVFIYPAHISCIKALAANSRFLATGSTDEHVKLYDLRLRKEVGTLMHHSGSITCLKFFGKTHLFTASEDGDITIVRCRDWEVLKTLSGHKRAVNSIDIHPSGKVLLSVGQDGTLKCWDLARAACTYSMKLPKAAERVCWSPSGSSYAVLMNDSVEIYGVEDGEVWGKIKVAGRINAIAFTTIAKKAYVITGSEDRTMAIWSPDGQMKSKWNTGHNNRVKDVDVFLTKNGVAFAASCSSDGGVKVWNLDSDLSADPQPIASYEAGCRLTCLVTARPAERKSN
ncbi:WD40-repeat-containing domain protein [Phlyctochytrium arcticum]|nr:WD40-repeat-containing domain protein [Phlyctochytrium arcticum]